MKKYFKNSYFLSHLFLTARPHLLIMKLDMLKQNTKILLILFVLLGMNAYSLSAQDLKEYEYPRGDYRVMFYNVENLFDTYNDSLKRDDDFTPQGQYYWSNRKYNNKLEKISKVIIGLGQWELPEIVGICEIENLRVLQDLISKTPLKGSSYGIIHKESPDSRGIDVGFLYRKDRFTPIEYEAVPIKFPFDGRTTRDILHVKGRFNSGDTVHFFVNHWPSRWGGQKETDRKRIFAAEVLKRKTDSLFRKDINPNIIIMGDFNDYPENTSLKDTLQALFNFDNPQPDKLYNLSYYIQENQAIGSHKYQGEWGVLDQMIVSGNLLKKEASLKTAPENNHVFNAPFLLEKDEKYVGYTTNRMYIGFRYHGGYADHLPVYLDLKINK